MTAPKDFHHPFEPYEIQQQFMEAVYQCIEEQKVGIFESPTGTGKSLSLICGSLTWLREHKRKTFDEAIASVQLDDDEPEWMVEHAREARKKEARQLRADLEARLTAVRERELQVRKRNANGEPPTKKRKQTEESKPQDSEEQQFVLDDYESDGEGSSQRNESNGLSLETTKLMEKLGMMSGKGQNDRAEDELDELKVFFCSRTHSQLSQFVGELNRVKLPAVLPPESNDASPLEELKHLTLGSRKNLCINSKVSKLSSLTAINDKCVELQQSNTPKDQKCGFLPNKENEAKVLDFRDHALASIRDIEDLAEVGKKLQVCPYYATRPAIRPAEIVTLPYPLLLQKSAREALGISLKGHVVIIDEAHNLMSAIEGICSTQISDAQLTRAREGLIIYLQKFRNRLKGKNRMYVTQVVRVIDSLLSCIAGLESRDDKGGTLLPSALLSGKAVDQVNLASLVRYISESKLARKVEGYVAYAQQKSQDPKVSTENDAPETPNLTQVQNFLLTIMNPSKEGRFFWAKERNTKVVRYMLLDPSEHFRDVVESARAVILAGGTMSHMEEYQHNLFPYNISIQTLSCGHLIPPSNLLVRTITSDRDGPVDFSFKARSNSGSHMRIANGLLELARHVRGGLVVFFPSYSFLDQVVVHWQSTKILTDLQAVKPIHIDSRTGAADDILTSYSNDVRNDPRKGAILFSVIGGKLSEGINFANDLGRCVLVIGLPFPNLETPEWKARMQYLDDKAVARGEAKGKASREHAENICMRSVNQAIGRVVRHKDDWASILLMDERYGRERTKGKLPGWIKECLPDAGRGDGDLQGASNAVSSFFKSKS